MALTLLPEEVLEQIVEYLEVRELLACSAVSLAWREKFNLDVFWKKFCFKNITDFLEDTPCDVEPPFTVPWHNEERLEPLCTWRLHYMRNMHLLNNWKSQKYSSFQIRPLVGVISSDVHVDSDGVHWLFIRTNSEIEIWNINTIPEHHSSISIFPDCYNISTFIVGKRVVVSQWNITSVYDLENIGGSVKTAFRFLLEGEKCLSEKFCDTTEKADIILLNESDDFRVICFGTILVGYKRIPNPPTDLFMHFWDMTTGEKMKTVSMSNHLCRENNVSFTNIFKINDSKGLVRLVFYSPENIMFSQLYIYDFKNPKFTSTDILFEGVAVWCGCTEDIVVTFSSHPGGTIKFYNCVSGKLLATKEIGEYTHSEQLRLIDSYFLYCMFNCMNVVDVHKQEVIYCLQFGFYSLVRRLTAINPRFVVVWLLEHGGSPGCPAYCQEVWDLKDLSSKLFQCSSELGYEMIAQSSSILKQVVAYDSIIYLYSFW